MFGFGDDVFDGSGCGGDDFHVDVLLGLAEGGGSRVGGEGDVSGVRLWGYLCLFSVDVVSFLFGTVYELGGVV